MVPVLCTFGGALLLGAFSFLPSVRGSAVQAWSILGAAALLLAWAGGLLLWASRAGRRFEVKVALRRQHWLTACVQIAIYAYWGHYFPPVRQAIPLILAQLVYAVTFDWLLSLTRRGQMTVGFGPFPITGSINIFLWFKPDWFYWQFVLVTLGFLAKELIRWERQGQRVHIFNPSSFPLGVFALGLLLTGTTDHTMGREIATSLFRPPWMYQFLFLAGLPGQLFFGVAPITVASILTVYSFGAAYYQIFGSYYFFDTNIPIVVFLGCHLLATDPSTSPRSLGGRLLFGVLYGVGVVALYAVLGAAHTDAFYDKLLPVPVLNLAVRRIDAAFLGAPGAARSRWRQLVERLSALPERGRNVAWMGAWGTVFAALSVSGQLVDNHPGNGLPFWRAACADHRRNACSNLALMELSFCRRGSGWACNELGVAMAKGRLQVPSMSAAEAFERACRSAVPEACDNRGRLDEAGPAAGDLSRPAPRVAEYELLTESKGYWSADNPFKLVDRACRQGWTEACVPKAIMLAQGQWTAPDPGAAAAILDEICRAGDASGCANLGVMYYRGDGLARNEPRAFELRRRACALGRRDQCISE